MKGTSSSTRSLGATKDRSPRRNLIAGPPRCSYSALSPSRKTRHKITTSQDQVELAEQQPLDRDRGDRRYGLCLRTNVTLLARNRDSANSVPCRDRAHPGLLVPGGATTASAHAAAPGSLCLCHGSDSRLDHVAVTAGDHRAVCSPQPAAVTADRRLAASRLPDGRISHRR